MIFFPPFKNGGLTVFLRQSNALIWPFKLQAREHSQCVSVRYNDIIIRALAATMWTRGWNKRREGGWRWHFGSAPASPMQLALNRHYCSRCWLQKPSDWLSQPLPASIWGVMVCVCVLKLIFFVRSMFFSLLFAEWIVGIRKQESNKVNSHIFLQVKTADWMSSQQRAMLPVALSSTTWERV